MHVLDWLHDGVEADIYDDGSWVAKSSRVTKNGNTVYHIYEGDDQHDADDHTHRIEVYDEDGCLMLEKDLPEEDEWALDE